jgi:hypothetical protein
MVKANSIVSYNFFFAKSMTIEGSFKAPVTQDEEGDGKLGMSCSTYLL